MPSKKKFIDKKHSTTFYLANRSQKDPLITDETAPQHVLVPLDQAGASSGKSSKKEKLDPATRKEELQKYGVYFDDDYDYLQHLKDSKDVSNIEWDVCERIYAPVEPKPKEELPKKSEMKDFKLKLPSSVFESEYVEEIGLLNKAAPSHSLRLDLDPEVCAAMDDDFDFENPENSLEDNFMELAGVDVEEVLDGEGRVITKADVEGLFSDEDEEMEEDEDDEEDRDTIGSLDGPHYNFSDDENENKSHFTNYSMSSSVLRRNQQLTLLDDRFEKMYEEYEDTEIGALDCDEIEGFVNPESQILLKCADEFEKECEKEKELHERIVRMGLKEESDDSDSSSDSDTAEDEKEKWDCESILSTYSNTKNRPRLIKEPSKRNIIKVSGKTGMPVGVLGTGLTEGKLKEMDRQYAAEQGQANVSCKTRSIMSSSSVWKPRPKEETPEERAERKKDIKEYRRERRIERKANSDAFKEEKKRQVKVRLNCKANTQGLKL